MTTQQKVRVVHNLKEAGFIVTKDMLSKLDYERSHRKDEERFLYRRIPKCNW